jgi:hypothetical protein
MTRHPTFFRHSIEDEKVIIEFNGIFKEVEGVFDVHDLENGLNDMLLFEWVTIMKDGIYYCLLSSVFGKDKEMK